MVSELAAIRTLLASLAPLLPLLSLAIPGRFVALAAR